MKHTRIAVLGGSGFVGRHVVNALVNQDREVIVPARAREHAKHLFLLPRVQIPEVNVRDAAALAAAIHGADAVINLIGVLRESPRAGFTQMHVGVAEAAIEACRQNGIRRLIQMSALNADPGGPSPYLRSKGEAEARVAASGLDWTVFQPSVIFGPEDKFLNLFAGIAKLLPVIYLAGAAARFQPVYVGDVAQAIVDSLEWQEACGRTYCLCGPHVYTLAQLVRYAGTLAGTPRPILPLPEALARIQAGLLELLPRPPMSVDNLDSMDLDSVCPAGPMLPFGRVPVALEAVAPQYLGANAPRLRYSGFRLKARR